MSFDDGFMLGLMMGGDESGGGKNYDINIVDGSESSITISVVTGRNSDDPTYNMERFTFATKKYVKTITLSSKYKSTTTTWTKNIVTSVTNYKGEKLFTMDVDDEGKTTACYDRSGNEILRGGTFEESIFTTTPEGIALGWALAYSKEQEELTEKAINDYKKATDDYKDVGGDPDDPVEVYENDLQGNYAQFDWGISYMGNKHHEGYVGDYVQIQGLDSSGFPTKVLIKNAKYFYQGKEKYPRNQDIEITSGSQALGDSYSITITGVIYDANGNPWTKDSTWSNPDNYDR